MRERFKPVDHFSFFFAKNYLPLKIVEIMSRLRHDGMEVWHPIREPIIGKDTNNNPIRAEPNSFNLPNGETLNPDTLRVCGIGAKRVKDSAQFNEIDNPYKVDETEEDVKLAKILATSMDRRIELKKALDRATSLVEDKLNASMTKDEAGEELKNVVASLNIDVYPIDADYGSSPSLSKLNKTQRIEMLIKLRTLFFGKNVTAKARCETEVNEFLQKSILHFLQRVVCMIY